MLKNVQALRAFAALLVVFDHVSYELTKSDPGGWTLLDGFRYFGQIGVDLFFVISGFIMVATTWGAFGRAGASATFMLRRLARIFPPYWLVLVPIVLAYLFAAHRFLHRVEGQADIVASILLLPTTHPRLLDISWTLTFELFFYIVFAGLLAFQRTMLLPLLAGWFMVESLAVLIFHDARNPYLSFLGTPLPMEFIFGAFIGYFYRERKMPAPLALGALGLTITGVIWIVSVIPGVTLHDLSKRDLARVVQFGVPAALIVYGAVAWELRKPSPAPRWLVGLGDGSYAMYLWHVPISLVIGAVVARYQVRGIIADSIVQVATVGVTICLSMIAFQIIERPCTTALNHLIERRIRRVTQPSITTAVRFNLPSSTE